MESHKPDEAYQVQEVCLTHQAVAKVEDLREQQGLGPCQDVACLQVVFGSEE